MTTILDHQTGRFHQADTAFDAVCLIAKVKVTPSPDGGWKVETVPHGYVAITPLWYGSSYSYDEVIRDAGATLVGRITRDCSRYSL